MPVCLLRNDFINLPYLIHLGPSHKVPRRCEESAGEESGGMGQ